MPTTRYYQTTSPEHGDQFYAVDLDRDARIVSVTTFDQTPSAHATSESFDEGAVGQNSPALWRDNVRAMWAGIDGADSSIHMSESSDSVYTRAALSTYLDNDSGIINAVNAENLPDHVKTYITA